MCKQNGIWFGSVSLFDSIVIDPYTQFLLTIISNEKVCWIFADVFVPNVNFNHYLIQCFGLLITASSMVVFVILFV